MKKITLIMATMSLVMSIHAQSLERSVLGAAGQVNARKNVQLEWTLGEVAVSHFRHSGGELTEGFHQPYLSVTPNEVLSAQDSRFQVFPNPTGSELFIQAQLRPNEQVQLSLIDPLGRLVLPRRKVKQQVKEQWNVQNLPAGHYYLLATDAQGKLLHSNKILKQ